MTTKIDGKALSAQILSRVCAKTQRLFRATGIQPGLAVIIVGENPASKLYVSSKGKSAKACGFLSVEHKLAENIHERVLIALIRELNQDDKIHGILLQLPLPPQIEEENVVQAISPQKDVDGFHLVNVGRLSSGWLEGTMIPCTPAGVMHLIKSVRGADLSGLTAVVVGRSNIVGKPMASLLLQANATVTIAHSRTQNLPALCRTADLLVAAVGRPEIVNADWIKSGATVIDVGINRLPPLCAGGKHRVVGDVDFASVMKIAGAVSPVPGGVGPMTIALLMENSLRAACQAGDFSDSLA